MTKFEDWQRIGDDDFAAFGSRSIHFTSADGRYTIEIDDANQNQVIHRKAGVETSWWVAMKEVSGETFRLSGASHLPKAWFELTLSSPAKIIYWPDHTIGQIDQEDAPVD